MASIQVMRLRLDGWAHLHCFEWRLSAVFVRVNSNSCQFGVARFALISTRSAIKLPIQRRTHICGLLVLARKFSENVGTFWAINLPCLPVKERQCDALFVSTAGACIRSQGWEIEKIFSWGGYILQPSIENHSK
jgi:hypothetical protein